MIDTSPTGFFLFLVLMVVAGAWIFNVPAEAPRAEGETKPDAQPKAG